MKRKTTKMFIDEAIKIHGNSYEYDLVDYVNNRTYISIKCKKHGFFKQTPYKHLIGRGCHTCGGTKLKTTELFIKEAIKIHNNKYEYKYTDYKNNHTKIKIICTTHGIFEQLPSDHLNKKCGCPICGNNIIRMSKYSNTNDFIRKSKIIHNT